MLDITCEDCGRTLIGLDRITSLDATDEGLRVAYVCWCGLAGAEITGRARGPQRAAPRREPAAA